MWTLISKLEVKYTGSVRLKNIKFMASSSAYGRVSMCGLSTERLGLKVHQFSKII